MSAGASHRELAEGLTPGSASGSSAPATCCRPTCRCSTGWSPAGWHGRDRSARAAPRRAPSSGARRPGLAPRRRRRGVLALRRRRRGVITPPAAHAELVRAALEARQARRVREAGRAVAGGGRAARSRSRRTRGLHLLAAPFVQLSPTFRELWTRVADGAIGARALGPRAVRQRGLDVGDLVPRRRRRAAGRGRDLQPQEPARCWGPVVEVLRGGGDGRAAPRDRGRRTIDDPGPDVVARRAAPRGGALSSVVASQAIQRYRRPGLELYGTEGTANLLGDDWDPRGFELWRNERGCWELCEPLDATWLWADGLRELVTALVEGRRRSRTPTTTCTCSTCSTPRGRRRARDGRSRSRRGRAAGLRLPSTPAAPPARPHAARRRAVRSGSRPASRSAREARCPRPRSAPGSGAGDSACRPAGSAGRSSSRYWITPCTKNSVIISSSPRTSRV